jgi:putative aminopeptidase FrvX
MDNIEKMLKEITEATGISGYETEIKVVLRRYLESSGQISYDKLGSLICRQDGTSLSPRVLIAAHMDEVGFMVKYITPEGFIKFTALGGWFDQVLLAHRVSIITHRGPVIGLIGAKPPHVLSEEERKKIVTKKEMYVDIGASSQKEVEEAGIRIGDPIVPISEFVVLSNAKTYMAKAFDDRLGCAVIVQVLHNLLGKHPNTLFGMATVQEEVGTRGANTGVEAVDPDIAIIAEVDIAGDVPGIKPEETPVKMNGGPVLLAYDARMIPNLKLRDMVIETAGQNNIPLQSSAMEGGATDGGVIHLHKTGVPTVVLGIPTRHIHSHNAIIHRNDFENMVKLVELIIQRLDTDTVANLTNW